MDVDVCGSSDGIEDMTKWYNLNHYYTGYDTLLLLDCMNDDYDIKYNNNNNKLNLNDEVSEIVVCYVHDHWTNQMWHE